MKNLNVQQTAILDIVDCRECGGDGDCRVFIAAIGGGVFGFNDLERCCGNDHSGGRFRLLTAPFSRRFYGFGLAAASADVFVFTPIGPSSWLYNNRNVVKLDRSGVCLGWNLSTDFYSYGTGSNLIFLLGNQTIPKTSANRVCNAASILFSSSSLIGVGMHKLIRKLVLANAAVLVAIVLVQDPLASQSVDASEVEK